MITPRNLTIGRRCILIAAALASYVGTEWGRFTYRPWVRENAIEDFGLADSIGSLGGTIVVVLLHVSLVPLKSLSIMHSGAAVVVGMVTYEFLQPYLGTGVFDWMDVFACVVGGGIALLAIKAVVGSSPARAAAEPAVVRHD